MPLSERKAQEIQDMVWALADDLLPPEETKRLEAMLMQDPEARQLYVQCMQLQADLHLFFNPDMAKLPTEVAVDSAAKKPSPVLTTLPQMGGIADGARV